MQTSPCAATRYGRHLSQRDKPPEHADAQVDDQIYSRELTTEPRQSFDRCAFTVLAFVEISIRIYQHGANGIFRIFFGTDRFREDLQRLVVIVWYQDRPGGGDWIACKPLLQFGHPSHICIAKERNYRHV